MCLANLEPQRLVRSREPLRVDGGRRGLQPLDAPAVKTVVPPSVSSLEKRQRLEQRGDIHERVAVFGDEPVDGVPRERGSVSRRSLVEHLPRADDVARNPSLRGTLARHPEDARLARRGRASVAQFEGRKRHQ